MSLWHAVSRILPGDWGKQWGHLITWHYFERNTWSPKSGILSLHHSGCYEGRTLCGCSIFGLPTPIVKTRKNWFQQPKDQKIFYLSFPTCISELPPPAQSLLCHDVYYALCLATSCGSEWKMLPLGPAWRRKRMYTASRWETLRHSMSSKVDLLRNFIGGRNVRLTC
jgi:hypothetical protein